MTDPTTATESPQVSSIGWLLFNRLVDRSRSISTVDKGFTYLRIRSISTVDKDSPTWKFGRYLIDRRFHPKIGQNRPSIWIHTKKNRSISTVDVPSYQKQIGRRSISIVEVDMDSKKSWTLTSLTHREIMLFIGKPIGRSMMISSTHPYFITNRCKWLTCMLSSFHGDQFQVLLTKQHIRKKQTHTDKLKNRWTQSQEYFKEELIVAKSFSEYPILPLVSVRT